MEKLGVSYAERWGRLFQIQNNLFAEYPREFKEVEHSR